MTEGLPILEQALSLSPGKQAIMFELIDAHLLQDNLDEAEELAQQAFESAPDYQQARIIYAATLIRNNKAEQADALLVPVYGTALVPELPIINAYALRNDLVILEQLWRARSEAFPEDVQARVSLAATLVELGRRTEAMGVLEQAVSDIPSFAPQGQEFIEAIRRGEVL